MMIFLWWRKKVWSFWGLGLITNASYVALMSQLWWIFLSKIIVGHGLRTVRYIEHVVGFHSFTVTFGYVLESKRMANDLHARILAFLDEMIIVVNILVKLYNIMVCVLEHIKNAGYMMHVWHLVQHHKLSNV